MSNRNALNFYIERIRQRLVLAAWMRGAATFTGTALIVTLALVLLLNHFAFPSRGLTGARLALFFAPHFRRGLASNLHFRQSNGPKHESETRQRCEISRFCLYLRQLIDSNRGK